MNSLHVSNTKNKITAEGVKNSNVKLLQKGTLLFSFKLTIGKVALAGKPLYTNEAIAGIVPKDENVVMTKYLYHLLSRLDYSIYTQSAAKGKTLNKSIMENIKIPVPDINIQKEIVKQMDDKESRKQELTENIDNITQSQNRIIEELTTSGSTGTN